MMTQPVAGVDLNAIANEANCERSAESKAVSSTCARVSRTFVSKEMAEELNS